LVFEFPKLRQQDRKILFKDKPVVEQIVVYLPQASPS